MLAATQDCDAQVTELQDAYIAAGCSTLHQGIVVPPTSTLLETSIQYFILVYNGRIIPIYELVTGKWLKHVLDQVKEHSK